jgi:predicted PurR-regulated permease PerM
VRPDKSTLPDLTSPAPSAFSSDARNGQTGIISRAIQRHTKRSLFMRRPILYAFVFLGVYLSYRVLSPFFVALTWAVLLAIFFRGMQMALTRRMGPNSAALITTLVVGVLIVGPAGVLISALAQEVPEAIESLQRASQSAPRQIQRVWDEVRTRSPVAVPEDPTELMARGAERALAYLAPQAGSLVTGFFGTLGTIAAMLFALFFFLRDAPTMSRYVRDRLPFPAPQSERLMDDTRDLVIASIGASLAVAAAQGAIGGVAFWLLGISAPVFWGVAIALLSLVPVVGAAVVWVPTSIWLMLSGAVGRGVALTLIGIFGISLIDNVLRPLILSGRTAVSGLVIFFGLLGGAAAFGLLGLLIGPIVLVTTARLFDELRRSDMAEKPAS